MYIDLDLSFLHYFYLHKPRGSYATGYLQFPSIYLCVQFLTTDCLYKNPLYTFVDSA